MSHAYGPPPEVTDYYRGASYAPYGKPSYYPLGTPTGADSLVGGHYPSDPVDYAGMYASGGYSHPSALGTPETPHNGYAMPYRSTGGGSSGSGSSVGSIGSTGNYGGRGASAGYPDSSEHVYASYVSTHPQQHHHHHHHQGQHRSDPSSYGLINSSNGSQSDSAPLCSDRTLPMPMPMSRVLTSTPTVDSYTSDYSSSSTTHRGSSLTNSSAASSTSPTSSISDAPTGYTSYEGSPTIAAYHASAVPGGVVVTTSDRDAAAAAAAADPYTTSSRSTESLYAGSQCSTPTSDMPYRIGATHVEDSMRRSSGGASPLSYATPTSAAPPHGLGAYMLSGGGDVGASESRSRSPSGQRGCMH